MSKSSPTEEWETQHFYSSCLRFRGPGKKKLSILLLNVDAIWCPLHVAMSLKDLHMEGLFPWIQTLMTEKVHLTIFHARYVKGGQCQNVMFCPRIDQFCFLLRDIAPGASLVIDVGYVCEKLESSIKRDN